MLGKNSPEDQFKIHSSDLESNSDEWKLFEKIGRSLADRFGSEVDATAWVVGPRTYRFLYYFMFEGKLASYERDFQEPHVSTFVNNYQVFNDLMAWCEEDIRLVLTPDVRNNEAAQ